MPPENILMPIEQAQEQLASVTMRQRDVIQELARGISNKQIAKRLGIKPKTVQAHLNNVYKRFGTKKRGYYATMYSVAFQGSTSVAGSTVGKELHNRATWSK